ncbi:MAG: AAA family ATPase [Bacteroidales bacterium]|jgi:predicted ATP-binding protein involved in virulence|nr:AAA family ATPase [Bacteroidales bacterium]
MRNFKINQYPYNESEKFYYKDNITFQPGVTILVGCNGSGKSTLLRSIRDQLKQSNIPVMHYDNYSEGGHNSMQNAVDISMTLLATLATSSEGEQIIVNIGQTAKEIGEFAKLHTNEKEIWILFDAIDSGLSIDNVMDIKKYLFNTILKDNLNKDVYIIASANGYEMCSNEQCFDVTEGKYTTFNSYKDYKKFILKSNLYKEHRNEKR